MKLSLKRYILEGEIVIFFGQFLFILSKIFQVRRNPYWRFPLHFGDLENMATPPQKDCRTTRTDDLIIIFIFLTEKRGDHF